MDLPNPVIELGYPALQVDSLPTELLGKHIKNQRHYFANKSSSIQAMVFPVVMYGCESWTIKKAELMLLNYGVGGDS